MRILFFVCLMSITSMLYGQSAELITISKDQLTSEQLKKLEVENQLAEIEKYSQWAGVGAEVGTAIKEGLSAVVDVAEQFSETKVGQFTMIMIAWKIVGKDIVKIVIGFLIGIMFTIFIFRSYNDKFRGYRVRTKGHWLKFWGEHEFERIKTGEYEGRELVRVIYVVLFFLGLFASYSIMVS